MAEHNKIPQRSEIPVEETWDLTDLYPNDAAWQRDLDETRALAARIPGYAGRLAERADTH